MDSNLVVSIQAMIFCLINLFIFIKVSNDNIITRSKKFFCGLALSCTLLQLSTAMDFFFYQVTPGTLPGCLHFFIIMVMFLSFTCTSLFWYMYLRLSIPNIGKLNLFQKFLAAGPVALTAALCSSSYWTHWVFYFNENGFYQRGPLVYLQTAIPYIFAIYAIVMIVREYVRGHRIALNKTTRNMFFMLIPAVVGAYIQMVLNIDGGYAQIGVSIGMIMIYFNMYIDEIQEVSRLQSLASINAELKKANNEKQEQLEKLMDQYDMVRTLSSTYMSSHLLNMEDGSFRELDTQSYIHNIVKDATSAKEAFDAFIPRGVAKGSQPEMRRFSNLETLSERLKEKNITFCDYESVNRGWCRANWLVLSRDENGNVKKAVYAVSDVDHDIRAEMEHRNIIKSISFLFNSVYYVNMSDLSFSEIASNSDKIKEIISGTGNAKDQFEKMFKFLCKPQFAEPMRAFCNLDTINERMKNRNWMSQQFESYSNEWTEGIFIVTDRDENGKIKHLIWCTRNIDESKRKEIAYEKSLSDIIEEQRTTLNIVSSLSEIYVAVYYVDILKETFQEITPASVDEVHKWIGTEGNAREKLLEMSRHLVSSEQAQETLEFTELTTLPVRLKDKQSIQYQFKGPHVGWCVGEYIAAVRDKNGMCTHALWTIRCVQEQKDKDELHRRELTEALKLAETANNAKTVFLNNMSHDIRTPMNAILGFAKLMEKELNDATALSAHLKKLQDSGQYLLSILNNVLDMARIDSGMMTLDEQFADLSAREEGFITIFEEQLKAKNLSFDVDINLEYPYVLLDPTKVGEIVSNLLSNAVKYTPAGGHISLKLEDKPCSRPGYRTYIMTVTDTGIGMTKEFMEHIFESFTRERNTTESKIAGTGLGMSIVKKIVDFMGGKIEVESELGKGTTFRVIVDHKTVDNPEDYIGKQKPMETETLNLKGKRLLIAEDNDLNAEIVLSILSDEGFQVERASDGIVCVDMVNKKPAGYYDLILMDIQMPNLNGYDATRKIRNFTDPQKANIPIIAMTANAFDEDKKAALESGMNGHLAKPVNVPELLRELSKNIR